MDPSGRKDDPHAAPPIPRLIHIDQLCDAFERTWQAATSSGQDRPRLSDFIATVPTHELSIALCELLLVELPYRRKLGEIPTAEEYSEQYPELAEAIQRVFHQEESRSATVDVSVTAGSTDRGTAQTPGSGDSSSEHDPLPEVAGYSVQEQIAEGGMGVVYRAIQLSTNRQVALKLLKSTVVSRSAHVRFQREVKLAASLTHPGIARVYDNVVDQGRYAYVMEFVDGSHLDEFVRKSNASPHEIARLMCEVCHALEYAHGNGIIHRDLKPSNILVRPTGEACVLDFGLARDVHRDDSDPTETGQVLGTPAYMSPEQAVGDHEHIDHRSDVYSLGIVLYKLLAGEVPFRGTPHAILNQVVHDTPPPPSKLGQVKAADLDAICLKAIEKEPSARYRSVLEMSQDFRHYLAGESIRAKPMNWRNRLVRWLKNPLRIRDSGIATVTMVAAFTIFHCIGTFLVVVGLDFKYNKPNPFMFSAAMLVSLIFGDIPYLILGVAILRLKLLGIILALLLDVGWCCIAIAFAVNPSLYPFPGVHATQSMLQSNWMIITAIVLFFFFFHLVALFAYLVNKRLIAWRKGFTQS